MELNRRQLGGALVGASAAALLAQAGRASALTPEDAGTAAAAKPPGRLRVVTYNVGGSTVGDRRVRTGVAALLAAKPHLVGLQEVADRATPLSQAVSEVGGYRLVWARAGDSRRHTAFIVRHDVAVRDKGTVRLNDWWKVPDDVGGAVSGRYPPRWLQWVKVGVGGATWTVGNVHFVAGAQKEKEPGRVTALLRHEAKRAATWYARHGSARTVLIGDFNAQSGSPYLAELDGIAVAHAKRSHGKTRIDIIWTKPDSRITVEDLAAHRYTSDHRAVSGTVVFTRP